MPDFVLQYLSKGYGFPVTNDDILPPSEVARLPPQPPPKKAFMALFDAKAKGAVISPSLEQSIDTWAEQAEGPVYACVPVPPRGAFMLHGDFNNKVVSFVKDVAQG